MDQDQDQDQNQDPVDQDPLDQDQDKDQDSPLPSPHIILSAVLITAVCPYENSQNLHNNNVHTVSLITYNLHPPCLHFPPSSFFVY